MALAGAHSSVSPAAIMNAAAVATACENCHSQLTDLDRHYGLGVRVEFLSHLAARALVK